MLRFGPKLALTGLQAPTLTAPFAKVVDPIVTDPWLRRFLDLECFVLRCVPQSEPNPGTVSSFDNTDLHPGYAQANAV